MSWTRSLLLNIAGGILVVLLLGNFALALVNSSKNAKLLALQQEIQKNRTTLSQAQEASTRVVRYLQALAGGLNQATQADSQFKAALVAADTTGIYAKFQDIVQKAIAAAQAAQANGSPTPAPPILSCHTMNDESHTPLGISAILLAVFLALILNQGYGMVEGFKTHSAMAQAEKDGAAMQDQLKPMLADLDSKKASVEADQKMAVDLTALIVRLAQDKNPTALKLVPALQQDLQTLGLSIQLQPNQVNGAPAASPSPPPAK